MAEEFQAGICGGKWWNPSRSVFAGAAAPCSVGLNHDVADFDWPSHDNKARSNSSGDTNNSVCESPNTAFQEVVQKPHHQNQTHSSPINNSGSVLIDSTLQMMGFGLSPTSLNQPNNLVRSIGRSESTNTNNNTMYSILQEDLGLTKLNCNYRQDHHIQAPLSPGFSGSPYSYYNNPAALLQSLFDGETEQPLPQQQSYSNNNSVNYSNYGSNNASISPSNGNTMLSSSTWPRNVSKPKQLPQSSGGLQFSNNTPFWNASEAVSSNEYDIRPSLSNFPRVPRRNTPMFEEQKPKCNNNNNNLTATKSNMACNEDQAHQTSSGNEQPALKRARIETPSPLPTFKVRKEKLGDRITALQQLVSPFGKTDTASVLQEAIDYIKFLHNQVLSTPYMKNGPPSVQLHHQGTNKLKNQETPKQDLKSQGLCLVPISSTFPVANETTADFWTPAFGGTFR